MSLTDCPHILSTPSAAASTIESSSAATDSPSAVLESCNPPLLSISWFGNLLDTFLCCEAEFKAVLVMVVTRPISRRLRSINSSLTSLIALRNNGPPPTDSGHVVQSRRTTWRSVNRSGHAGLHYEHSFSICDVDFSGSNSMPRENWAGDPFLLSQGNWAPRENWRGVEEGEGEERDC
ncbi:unnamed protein product [Fraxinus pennsylvanica]|uniref:Uncharacterized protein n=1 Tax=Fraxinus pennsylvanica TaxID=56036 RepID=A0AAD2DI55_9LAMI|nr:unnamed protein product [Fraxinus pennsylvanica]